MSEAIVIKGSAAISFKLLPANVASTDIHANTIWYKLKKQLGSRIFSVMGKHTRSDRRNHHQRSAKLAFSVMAVPFVNE
jgi:3-phenylpropionate/cinnamic acid dioxygenase small subunit